MAKKVQRVQEVTRKSFEAPQEVWDLLKEFRFANQHRSEKDALHAMIRIAAASKEKPRKTKP